MGYDGGLTAGINAHGDVVFSRRADPLSEDPGGPVLVRDGESYDLPPLPGVPTFDAQHFTTLAALSDDAATIVGTQPRGDGKVVVLWRC